MYEIIITYRPVPQIIIYGLHLILNALCSVYILTVQLLNGSHVVYVGNHRFCFSYS